MSMTAGDMIEEIRSNLKRTTDGLANTRLLVFLNWGQTFVADLHTYEEMRRKYTASTADGQKTYGFPTNMKDIYSLILVDGASSRKLVYVYPREFDDKVPYPEQTTEGRSAYYVDYGVNFELYRIPDKAYTLNLRCSVYPTDFTISTTGSASELLRKDGLMVACATMMGFYNVREVEDAAYWKVEVIPQLFNASLLSDHNAEDWTPVARGFDTKAERVGEYWSNPLIKSMP